MKILIHDFFKRWWWAVALAAGFAFVNCLVELPRAGAMASAGKGSELWAIVTIGLVLLSVAGSILLATDDQAGHLRAVRTMPVSARSTTLAFSLLCMGLFPLFAFILQFFTWSAALAIWGVGAVAVSLDSFLMTPVVCVTAAGSVFFLFSIRPSYATGSGSAFYRGPWGILWGLSLVYVLIFFFRLFDLSSGQPTAGQIAVLIIGVLCAAVSPFLFHVRLVRDVFSGGARAVSGLDGRGRRGKAAASIRFRNTAYPLAHLNARFATRLFIGTFVALLWVLVFMGIVVFLKTREWEAGLSAIHMRRPDNSFFFVFAFMPIMLPLLAVVASAHWLQSLRAFRALPRSTTRCGLLIASFPATAGLAAMTAVLLFCALGGLGGVALATLACTWPAFAGLSVLASLAMVKWPRIAPFGMLLFSILVFGFISANRALREAVFFGSMPHPEIVLAMGFLVFAAAVWLTVYWLKRGWIPFNTRILPKTFEM